MAESPDVKQEKLNKKASKQKKQFKLCFVNKREVGRSYVQTNVPLKTVLPLTSKFYKCTENEMEYSNLGDKIEMLKVYGPHEKYTKPKTENQRYGWYTLKVDNEERKNFKHMDQMVKENLMNFEKIRDFD